MNSDDPDMTVNNDVGRNTYDEVCSSCDPSTLCPTGFVKVLDFENIGLFIYRRSVNTDSQYNRSDKGSLKTVVLHNKTDADLTSDDFLREMQKNEIKCERCRKIIELALKLLSRVPAINKTSMMTVCSHCKLKYPCRECKQAQKSLLSENEAEMRREQVTKPHIFKENADKVPDKSVDKKSSKPRKVTESIIRIERLLHQKFAKSQREIEISDICSTTPRSSKTLPDIGKGKKYYQTDKHLVVRPSCDSKMYVHKDTKITFAPHDVQLADLDDNIKESRYSQSTLLEKHSLTNFASFSHTSKDTGATVIKDKIVMKPRPDHQTQKRISGIETNFENSELEKKSFMTISKLKSQESKSQEFTFSFPFENYELRKPHSRHKTSADLTKEIRDMLHSKQEEKRKEMSEIRKQKEDERERKRLAKEKYKKAAEYESKAKKSISKYEDSALKEDIEVKKTEEKEEDHSKKVKSRKETKTSDKRPAVKDIPKTQDERFTFNSKQETDKTQITQKDIKKPEEVENAKTKELRKIEHSTKIENEKKIGNDIALKEKEKDQELLNNKENQQPENEKDFQKTRRTSNKKLKSDHIIQSVKKQKLDEQVTKTGEEGKKLQTLKQKQELSPTNMPKRKKSNKPEEPSHMKLQKSSNKTTDKITSPNKQLEQKQEFGITDILKGKKKSKDLSQQKRLRALSNRKIANAISTNKLPKRKKEPLKLKFSKMRLQKPQEILVKFKEGSKYSYKGKSLRQHWDIHEKCHRVLRDHECPYCLNSDLELNADLKLQKHTITEFIKGHKIVNINKLRDSPDTEIKPLLFATRIEIPNVFNIEGKDKESLENPETPLDKGQNTDTSGVIRYVLSDPTFIDKGWTVLPTEKVMRKINVYRMRPAKPEYNWFKRNKKKQLMLYESGERFAEHEGDGRWRWYYKNQQPALDYYEAEELNAQKRFVIYSNGEPDEHGRARPYTILATFDYLGNCVVFDHGGNVRLKYNQTEGVVLDKTIGPVSHWKWHTLNDPPDLRQVMIDTHLAHKDPDIFALGHDLGRKSNFHNSSDNDEMLAIEFENFVRDKSMKLSRKFKPFQIKMKALKINEHFSLKVLDQANVYLIYRDGTTNVKLNLGMLLDHKEIVDTDMIEVGDVAINMERLPALTDSLAAMQRHVANAQEFEKSWTERERRLRLPPPIASADKLTAGVSRPLYPALRATQSLTATSTTSRHSPAKPNCSMYRKLSSNLSYSSM